MKVNQRNTRLLFYLSILNTLVCAIFLLFLPVEAFGTVVYMILFIEFGLFLTVSLVYLIKILSWFKERTAVIAAFTMFTCLLGVTLIVTTFPRLLNNSLSNSLDILTEVTSLLVIFRSFWVRTEVLSVYFKIFGTGIALITLPRFVVMLTNLHFNETSIQLTNDAGLLVMLVALCCIQKKMLTFLKSNPDEPIEA